MEDSIFWLVATISVISSILVVTRKNPIYSALFMLVAFLSFAVIFLILHAPFLAAMHLMVYTGAILVLFLFVIMLLNLKKEELGKEFSATMKGLVGLLCLAVFVIFAIAFANSYIQSQGAVPPNFGSAVTVGKEIFSKFIFPFELLSVMIIVAIVGAIILAKKN